MTAVQTCTPKVPNGTETSMDQQGIDPFLGFFNFRVFRLKAYEGNQQAKKVAAFEGGSEQGRTASILDSGAKCREGAQVLCPTQPRWATKGQSVPDPLKPPLASTAPAQKNPQAGADSSSPKGSSVPENVAGWLHKSTPFPNISPTPARNYSRIRHREGFTGGSEGTCEGQSAAFTALPLPDNSWERTTIQRGSPKIWVFQKTGTGGPRQICQHLNSIPKNRDSPILGENTYSNPPQNVLWS